MIDYNKDTKKGYISDDIAKISKDKYESWSLYNLGTKIIASAEKKTITEFLDKLKLVNPRILDIPCGTGKLSNILLNRGYVVASDISPNMIKFAMSCYDDGKFLGFSISDISKTAFKKDSFDCIICLRLMHRVPEDIRIDMLYELYNICSKYLIISFGYEDALQNIKRRLVKKLYGNDPTPCAKKIEAIEKELVLTHWTIKDKKVILPLISSEIIYVCEKLKFK